MSNDHNKYEFKQYSLNDKCLICPQCFETLVQEDIEHFSTCPYCDYQFELNSEIEDFILKPLVDYWIQQECQRPSREETARQIVLR